jgi:alpha-mannosidase
LFAWLKQAQNEFENVSNQQGPSNMTKKIHLICNAHLDPVWLWPWEDGLAETISTFRIAADFCEEYAGFVFNHNESLLYEWIEEYDPALFARIKKLVENKQWHIAGGSFIQPDINNVSGESNIRQFLQGKAYFQSRFGVEPTTAYNFDPFGQPEGYPQILQGCGFDSYIFCRPAPVEWELPRGSFSWEDRSGSRVTARRSDDHYLTNGRVYSELETWLEHYKDEPETMILWGVGNHGGGISHQEHDELQRFVKDHGESYELIHSTPERFFAEGLQAHETLPVVKGEFQNNFPGCYTSMARVKHRHRRLENLMGVTERLAAWSWFNGNLPYPKAELEEAWKDILFLEFHDILPGSGVKSVENDALSRAGHAEEILRRIKMRGLVGMVQETAAAAEGSVPIFVWNPHGREIETVVECEYNISHLAVPRNNARIRLVDEQGLPVVFQREKEEANLNNDWRVRICFPVRLPAFGCRRFEASYTKEENASSFAVTRLQNDPFEFSNDEYRISLNPDTGLIDCFAESGNDSSLVGENAFRPVIFEDLDHSWTCGDPDTFAKAKDELRNSSFPWGEPVDEFHLATDRELLEIVAAPGGGKKITTPVAVVEDGPVRTVVEAVFACRRSYIVRHYVLGRTPASFEIKDYVFWNEKSKMLKVQIPLAFDLDGSMAETVYSAIYRKTQEAHHDVTGQRWLAAREQETGGRFLGCVSDCIGAHSVHNGSLYLSLLRSPAYSSFGLPDNAPEFSERFIVRQDQGEHSFRYGFTGGSKFDETALQQAADLFNLPPEWKVYFPNGDAEKPRVAETRLDISAPNVQLCALKRAEDADGLIVRLRETGGNATAFTLTLPGHDGFELKINAWSLLTVKITRDGDARSCRATNLLEA